MENMLKLSPKIPYGAKIWDECGKTKIVQILISHSNSGVGAIQFVYAVDGKLHRSEMHGEFSNSKFDMVTFDYPDEYLTSLNGQYYSSNTILASIVFGTNKRKYGPFGRIDIPNRINPLTHFEYNFTPKSSFGGFHGRVCSTCVCTIGVYIRPLDSLAETGAGIGSNKELKTEV